MDITLEKGATNTTNFGDSGCVAVGETEDLKDISTYERDDDIFRKSCSTGSIRFIDSNENLAGDKESTSSVTEARSTEARSLENLEYDRSLRQIRNKGSKKRKDGEAVEKSKYEEEFKKKLKDLEKTFFGKVKIHESIRDAYGKNAAGEGPNYLHVKPRWSNFTGWHNYVSFMSNSKTDSESRFEITSPERCLFYFLNSMKDKGYFGFNDTIKWLLVDDERNRDSKGQKKIRFHWDDVSSFSPDVSPTHSPYNSSNKLEELDEDDN